MGYFINLVCIVVSISFITIFIINILRSMVKVIIKDIRSSFKTSSKEPDQISMERETEYIIKINKKILSDPNYIEPPKPPKFPGSQDYPY